MRESETERDGEVYLFIVFFSPQMPEDRKKMRYCYTEFRRFVYFAECTGHEMWESETERLSEFLIIYSFRPRLSKVRDKKMKCGKIGS